MDDINDKQLQLLHKSNGGAVNARKATIANVLTDYAVLDDANDYFKEHACEVLRQNAMESNAK